MVDRLRYVIVSVIRSLRIFMVAVVGILGLLASPNTLACQLGATWASVDVFAADRAVPAAVASGGDGVFVVGKARSASGNDYWLTRRSLDRGATWSTVDAWNPPFNSRAQAIAYDRSRARVYAGGNVVGPQGVAHWVVRRSDDDGATWTMLPDAPAANPVDLLGGLALVGGKLVVVTNVQGERPAGDARGRVWVYDEAAGAWAVEHASAIAYTAIAGAEDGRAYAAGTEVDAEGNPRFCATGRRDSRGAWVDSPSVRSPVTACLHVAVALRESDGAVAFAGSADHGDLSRRWRVLRLEGQVAPGRELIEEFPAASGPYEAAAAMAATFTLDGRLIVAGAQDFSSTLLTRISDAALTSFTPSDQLAGVPISLDGRTEASGAATSPRGDVYVAGSWVSDGGSRWVTRQLRCD